MNIRRLSARLFIQLFILLSALFSINFVSNVSAAPISFAEYFIGTDPGEGFGVTIPAPVDGVYDSTVEQVEFDVDTGKLKIGHHTIYVRMKNADGVWGVARPIPNDLELAAPYNLTVDGTKTITAAEYFIGADLSADPGPGNGIQISLPTDGLFNSGLEDLEIPIDTTGLEAGLHTVYVRSLDSNGDWGVVRQYTFEVSATNVILGGKVAVDADPVLEESTLVDDFSVGGTWTENQATESTNNGIYNVTLTSTADPYFYKNIADFSASLNYLVIRYRSYTNGPNEIRLFYTDGVDCTAWNSICAQSFPIIRDGAWHTLTAQVTDPEWTDNDGAITQLRFDLEGATATGTFSMDEIWFANQPMARPFAAVDGGFDESTEEGTSSLDTTELGSEGHRLYVRMRDKTGYSPVIVHSLGVSVPAVQITLQPLQAPGSGGDIPFIVLVEDHAGGEYRLKAEYSTDGSNWKKTTLIGALVDNSQSFQVGPIATASSASLPLTWQSAADLANKEHAYVALRLTIDDSAGRFAETLSTNFTIDNLAPSVPSLITPPNGSETTDPTPLFVWQAVGMGITHHIQVDNQADFSSPEVNTGTLNNFFIPAFSLIPGHYFWRVRATDAMGNVSAYSNVADFLLQSDFVGPAVSLSYSANPAGAGSLAIVAMFSEPVTTIPTIAIDQPGAEDLSPTSMIGSGNVWVYLYDVYRADGSAYIDGVARVTIANGRDAAGNENQVATNDTFVIATGQPNGTIIAAEYFIDTDPGEGLGTPVPVPVDGAYDGSKEQTEFIIDTSNLKIGLHTVYVRMKNADGVWGVARPLSNDLELAAPYNLTVEGIKAITAAEYFIDTDSGTGNGVPVPVPADGAFDGGIEDLAISALDTAELSVGLHTVYVRAKDSNEDWGVLRQYTFEVSAPNVILGGKVAVDADPLFEESNMVDDFSDGEIWTENQATGSANDGIFNATLTSTVDPYFYKNTADFASSLNHLVMRYRSYTNGPNEIRFFYTDGVDCTAWNSICAQSFPIISDGAWHTLTAQITDPEWVDNDGAITQLRFDLEGATATGTFSVDEIWFANQPMSKPLTSVDGGFDEGMEEATSSVDTTELGSGGHLLYVRMQDKTGYGPVVMHSLGVSVPSVQITSLSVQTPGSGGEIPFTALVEDHAGGDYRMKVEYSTDGINWKKATLNGSLVDNAQAMQVGPIATSGGGASLPLIWQSAADLSNQEHAAVSLRLSLDNGGGSTAQAVSGFFAIDNKAPHEPILLLPPDGSETNDPTPLFVWQAVEQGVTYRLQVDNQADFSSQELVIDEFLTGNFFVSGTPLIPGRYFWRVRATDEIGHSSYSPASDFLLLSDGTPPEVSLSYSSVPATVGPLVITATFSEVVETVPTIEIAQQGVRDIALTAMSGSGKVWTYVYEVHKATGSNPGVDDYVDGVAMVIIANGKDAAGNENQPVTNDTFVIDTSQLPGTIVGAEYFIDTDPGEGLGVPIPASVDGIYDSVKEEVEFSIDTSALKIGRHTVYVRMKNADGVWGVARPIPNDLELAAPYNLTVEGTKTITAAEYFIGADLSAVPGPGSGIQISFPADGSFDSGIEDMEIPLDTTGLEAGLHTLYVRAQDNNGDWGVLRQYTFEVSAVNVILGGKVAVDADPLFEESNLIDDFSGGETWTENQITGSANNGIYSAAVTALTDPYFWKNISDFDESLNYFVIRYRSYTNGPNAISVSYTDGVDCAAFNVTCSQTFSIIRDGAWHTLTAQITDQEWLDNDGAITQLRFDLEGATVTGTFSVDEIWFANQPMAKSLTAVDGGFDEGMEEAISNVDTTELGNGGHKLYVRMLDKTGYGPAVIHSLGVSTPAVQITSQPVQTPGTGGNIPFTVLVEDHAGGTYRMKVEYSTDGINWKKATVTGSLVDNAEAFQVGPIATASSMSLPLTWQSSVDLANKEHAYVALRLTIDDGTGRFAETLSSNFSIDNLAPPVPILITPSNASETKDPTPLFVWQAVGEGVTYHLQVDNQADFSSPEVNTDTLNNFFVPALSLIPGHHFWRVKATDEMGNVSTYSDIADFLLRSKFIGPAVSLSYSANPAGAGSLAIVAMFSEPVNTIPTIAIDQAGTEDLLPTSMIGSGNVWVYLYDVHRAYGSAYIDGVVRVTIANGKDAAGNENQPATNDTFVINTGQPSGTIIAAEYFVDTDPGEGLGVPIPLPVDSTYDGSKEQIEFSIDTSILKIGRHTVYVRMKNADGVWGVARPIRNDLEFAAPYNLTVEGTKTLTASEYFIDTDPGAGNGTPIPVPVDGAYDNPEEGMELSLNTASITEGLHTVYMRARDNNGDWGPTNQYTFEVRKSSGIIIDGGEYFIDSDPGEGNGSPLNPVDGALDEMVEQIQVLHDTAGLIEGAHQVFVRARSSEGTWSQAVSQPLMVGPYPYITGISPAYGQSGSLVSVTGLNFGISQGISSITFNGITATPIGWTDTEVTVPVPDGAASGPVVVTVNGNPSNADQLFTVIYPPVILGLSPDIGIVGSYVTITGSNFGENRGVGMVTFNDVTAPVVTWSTNSIVTMAPTGATTGAVVVKVRGLASNADHIFTLLPPDGDEDGDGLSNADEAARGTDMRNPDTDGDGMPDGWEVANGLNPLLNDAGLDPDGDGLTNLKEYEMGTKPNVCDTDGDSVCDGDDFDPIVPGVITIKPDEPLITVAIGGTRTFHVNVQNLQNFPDWVSLSLEGLDPSWYTLSQDNVFLLPGQKRAVAIHVTIPENCSLTAASHSFTIHGISSLGGKEDTAAAGLVIDPDPEVRPLFGAVNETAGNNSITIAWRTNILTTTEVNYKKSGDASFTQVTGTPGLEHEVTLTDLQWGETYQWYTVSRSACGETQTAIQQGTISRGVVFNLRGTEVNVDRDYNQPVSMTITNIDSVAHIAKVRLINPYDDIVAGFVGTGSETSPLEITPGETVTAQLYVHAQDARATRYVLYADVEADSQSPVPIHDRVPVIVNVRPYVFNVELKEVDHNIASLTNLYRVINYGDTVTDLRIYVEGENGSKVFLNPTVNHARLVNSGFIEFKLTADVPLTGVLVTESSAGSTRLPFQIGCLPGQDLREITISNPTIEAQVGDWYCTNKQDFEIPFYLPSGYMREDIQQVYMKATFRPLHPVTDITPHDVMLYINGEPVWTLFDDVPNGEYTIDIPASLLHIASEGTGSNYLRIRAEGINEGAYLATTDFVIGVVLDQMTLNVCGMEPPCPNCVQPPPPPCPYVSNVEVSRDGEPNRVNGQYQFNFRPGQTVDILATVKNPLGTSQQVTATIHLISDVGGEVIVDQPIKTILLDPNGFRSVVWRYTIPEDADDLNYSVRVDVAGDNCIRSANSGFRVRTPVVIVPGMMGSYLYEQQYGTQVWPNIFGSVLDEAVIRGPRTVYDFYSLLANPLVYLGELVIEEAATELIDAQIDKIATLTGVLCTEMNLMYQNRIPCDLIGSIIRNEVRLLAVSSVSPQTIIKTIEDLILHYVNDCHLAHLVMDENGQPTTITKGDCKSDELYTTSTTLDVRGPIALLYGGLKKSLIDRGYIENQDFFFYPYDWRMYIELISLGLSEKVQAIQDQTKSKRVNIVAHSMGGLIAEHYIKYRATPSTVKDLVMLGTPHLGAPKALKGLICGEMGNALDPVLEDWRVQAAVINMPSVYQLIPSRAYFEKYPEGIFFDYTNSSPLPTYDETRDFLKGKDFNVTPDLFRRYGMGNEYPFPPIISDFLLGKADELHSNLDGNWNGEDYGVNTYNVVGCGRKTIGRLLKTTQGVKEDYVTGDGTVPLWSALDVASGRTYAVEGGEHGALPNYLKVNALIGDILKGVPQIRYEGVSGIIPSVVPYDEAQCQIQDGVFISFDFVSELLSDNPLESYCKGSPPPWRLSIPELPGIEPPPYCLLYPWKCVDFPEEINICNPLTEECIGVKRPGGISLEIPGADYSMTENGVYAYIPGSGALVIRFRGVDAGYVNLKFQLMQQGGVNRTVIFYRVPMTPETQGMLEWSQDDAQDYILYLDQNGDGVYETQVFPLSIGGPGISTDYIPPATSAVVEGTMGENQWYTTPVRVTLSAADNADGSGVAFTEYAAGNRPNAWTRYTGKVTLNAPGTYDMLYYSVDFAGNTEAPNNLSLKVDTTPPSTPSVTDSGRYAFDTSQLVSSWTSVDPESGLTLAEYSIGTQPGLNDVVDWSGTSLIAPVEGSGLALQHNQTYYVNVRTKNSAGLWSGVSSSNGITILDPSGDSDGDGISNEMEVSSKSDPLDRFSYPGAGAVGTLKGFNLISLQGDLAEILDENNPSAFKVLQLFGGPDKISRIQKIDSAPGLVREARYEGGAPVGDDFNIGPGDGLIVYGKMDTVIPFTSVICPAWNLHVGANLVGSPCAPSGMTAFQLLQDLGGETAVTSIQRFNADKGRFDTAAYENGQPVGVDFQIVPGEGYFVYMKQARLGFRP